MIKFLLFFVILNFFNFAIAQDTVLTLKQQLDRLQREVGDLSKTVFSEPDSKSNKKVNISSLTAFDLRIYDLENDIKKLNNNFEELIFQIDDLSSLYKSLSLELSTINLKSSNNKDNKLIDQENISLDPKIDNSLGSLKINSEDLSNDEVTVSNQNLDNEILSLEPDEYFQKAFDMLRSQKFDEAKKAFINFIKIHNNNKLAGSAHYWLGEIYFLKKNYRDAALIFAEGYQKFPKSVKAPDMLYKLSEALVFIEKKEDACNTLKKFAKEFPENKLKIKAENKKKSLKCVSLTE